MEEDVSSLFSFGSRALAVPDDVGYVFGRLVAHTAVSWDVLVILLASVFSCECVAHSHARDAHFRCSG